MPRRARQTATEAGLVLTLTVLGLTISSVAHGWASEEHYELGMQAFERACAKLEDDSTVPSNDRARVNQLACTSGRAELYGQATALFGDYVTAGDLRSNWPQIEAARIVRAASKALTNAQHFHPLALRTWRELHQHALHLVIKARASSLPQQLAALQAALYLNALGDHFLQDSFSAGHFGFNRPASPPSASLSYHDNLNTTGRWMQSCGGERWIGYGDGMLKNPGNFANKIHVREAAYRSVVEILYALATGTVTPAMSQRTRDSQLCQVQEVRFERAKDRGLSMRRPIYAGFAHVDSVQKPVQGGSEWGLSTTARVLPGDLNYVLPEVEYGTMLHKWIRAGGLLGVGASLEDGRPSVLVSGALFGEVPVAGPYGSVASFAFRLLLRGLVGPEYRLFGGYFGPRVGVDAGPVMLMLGAYAGPAITNDGYQTDLQISAGVHVPIDTIGGGAMRW